LASGLVDRIYLTPATVDEPHWSVPSPNSIRAAGGFSKPEGLSEPTWWKAPWMKHERRAPLTHVALEVGDIEEACAAQDWRASKELNEKGMAPS